MGSFLGVRFYSIDQPVCFYANTMGFFYYCSVVQLEIRDGNISRSSFIVQNCFSYPEVFFLFVFLYEVENCSFMFLKELFWSFGGNFIESVDYF